MPGRNRLILNLNEWRDELKAEPTALADAARPIVLTAADDAAHTIADRYPTGPTGNLKRGVKVGRPPTGPAITKASVISSAPHAHLYEYGTHVARAHPTFFPATEARGRTMLEDVNAMVRSRGLAVSGRVD
jgi:hypothetical protein